jgi:hypothetical protein
MPQRVKQPSSLPQDIVSPAAELEEGLLSLLFVMMLAHPW